MSNFENLKSMDIDKLAEWLDTNTQWDGSPWCDWFDETYCKNCPAEVIEVESDWRHECECGWCEINGKCRFFQDMDDVPGSKEIVKMWLESGSKDEEL